MKVLSIIQSPSVIVKVKQTGGKYLLFAKGKEGEKSIEFPGLNAFKSFISHNPFFPYPNLTFMEGSRIMKQIKEVTNNE